MKSDCQNLFPETWNLWKVMKNKFQKIIFGGGYGVLIFFLTNHPSFGIFLPNIDGGWCSKYMC